LLRPAWEKTEGDRWIEVECYQEAALILPQLAQRVFLSLGRQDLAAFLALPDRWFLMRMVDPPPINTPLPLGKVLLERGPFRLEQERSLLQQYEIGAIVSKNSGGRATYPKIIAARELGLPVIMIQRPSIPIAEKVATVEEAIHWLRHQVEKNN
jgi:precorrin-6A/cobalt-precorrin-6A reductase